jgi:arsenate reductase (thioredoxin)
MGGVPVVLFVCTHNAGRSQMAAALLDHEAAGRVKVTSAGSQPAAELNPAVVAAMAEIGLDICREFPKPLTADNVSSADVVITMGCGDACPVFPGSATSTGTCPTQPALTLKRSGRSVTTFASGSSACSPISASRHDPAGWTGRRLAERAAAFVAAVRRSSAHVPAEAGDGPAQVGSDRFWDVAARAVPVR